jgi:rare lipoprotein A
MTLRWILILLIGVFSVSCARNAAATRARSGGGFYQEGMASWYGEQFHGRKTASGEPFDMFKFTAAHRTLPFGTIVHVRSRSSGETVDVRINDRGPYSRKRVIDVSYAAARQLGMVQKGHDRVEITGP